MRDVSFAITVILLTGILINQFTGYYTFASFMGALTGTTLLAAFFAAVVVAVLELLEEDE